MPNINAAVQWAITTANDDTHGYSMTNRLGNPDYDCSSFIAAALIAGGFNVPNYMYTGIEYNCLIAAGFTTVPVNSERKKGDIFMWDGSGNAGHTLMCIDETHIVEARGDTDGLPGDGDGTEIWITTFYDYGWQYHFRYPGGAGRTAIWHNKNIGGWAKESYEAQDNAIMTYNTLAAYGWTMNAVAALLGNIGAESAYNPWIWEGSLSQDNRVASTDTSALESNNHGYGLLQFTPSANYCRSQIAQQSPDFGPNYLDIAGNRNDGTSQLEFMHVTNASAYYPTASYPETYAEFIHSNRDADYLAAAWFYNYERGDPSSVPQRQTDGLWWQNILPTLIEKKTRRMPIWMYLKPTRRR